MEPIGKQQVLIKHGRMPGNLGRAFETIVLWSKPPSRRSCDHFEAIFTVLLREGLTLTGKQWGVNLGRRKDP